METCIRQREVSFAVCELMEQLCSGAAAKGRIVEYFITGSLAKGTQVWKNCEADDVDILVLFGLPSGENVEELDTTEYLVLVLDLATDALAHGDVDCSTIPVRPSARLTFPSVTVDCQGHA